MPGAAFRIGCSGWSYKHWRGDFYPQDLPQHRWFRHYSERFDTVELNTTFYRLPSEKAVDAWAVAAPEGFAFAIKASRLITHFHRLHNASEALETLFERMSRLASHTGPYLYQLPDSFERDDSRLQSFLEALPEEHLHAFEFRHKSWWDSSVYRLLEKFGAIFVMFDQAGRRTPVVATSSQVYLRMHGPSGGYSGGYSSEALAAWRDGLQDLPIGTAWVYFNNDAGGQAPRDAATLLRLVEKS